MAQDQPRLDSLPPYKNPPTSGSISLITKIPTFDSASVNRNRPTQVTSYKRTNVLDRAGEDEYEVIALRVHLRFTEKNRVALKEIVARPAKELNHSTQDTQVLSPPEPVKSLQKLTPFKRSWVDETYAFSMKSVRSAIRKDDDNVRDLGPNYRWYSQAVPVDAIFPPGIPMTAHELLAFYPHHLRWKGVMMRLTKNGYRGVDMEDMQAQFRGTPNLQSAVSLSKIQRDSMRGFAQDFQISTRTGKGHSNLRTDIFHPGSHIKSFRKGYSIPTFEDLVCGLKYVPHGLHARDLTQCLVWYLDIRDTFTPRLALNVLHTQSLVRALRQPLRPSGPLNLDRVGLEEWHQENKLNVRQANHENIHPKNTNADNVQSARNQINVDPKQETVTMNITLPLRHVLTLPFLALHNVVGEAFKMGIEKATIHEAARKQTEPQSQIHARLATHPPRGVVNKEASPSPTSANSSASATTGVQICPTEPYRIPKRPRPDAMSLDGADVPAKRQMYNMPGPQRMSDQRSTITHGSWAGSSFRPILPRPPVPVPSSYTTSGFPIRTSLTSSAGQIRHEEDSVYGRR